MKYTALIICALLASKITSFAQDANNPIDPSPTLGIFNRAYGNEKSMTQLLGNIAYEKWFFRVTAEMEFDYQDINQPTGGNFMVARLFESKNGKHKYGAGGVFSYNHEKGAAGGINFVSVSQMGNWKLISLTSVVSGNDIFTMEFQPGIYYRFPSGWYLRSHPRMLFDFTTGTYEAPVGAGVGKVFKAKETTINVFAEPQYDLIQKTPMVYMGTKFVF